MSQVSLDGSKAEIKPSCKRCYFNNYYGGCLCAITHNSENPTKCRGFTLIDELWRVSLEGQGWGSVLVKHLGYWEWQDDS